MIAQSTIAQAFKDQYLSFMGLPHRMQVDGGKNIAQGEMRLFRSLVGIEGAAFAHTHQTLIENTFLFLREWSREIGATGYGSRWSEFLWRANLTTRNMLSNVSGVASSEVLFVRRVCTGNEFLTPGLEKPVTMQDVTRARAAAIALNSEGRGESSNQCD